MILYYYYHIISLYLYIILDIICTRTRSMILHTTIYYDNTINNTNTRVDFDFFEKMEFKNLMRQFCAKSTN